MRPFLGKILLVQAFIFSLIIANVSAQTKGMGKLLNGEAPVGTERRLALVIGNKDYQNISILTNPVNDAEDMSKALQELGFEVNLLINADDSKMKKSFRDFSAKVHFGDVAVVYYSGHGISFSGKNYLLPIDVEINCLGEIEDYKNIESLIQALDNKGVRNSFVFLDACRNLPEVKPCPSDTKDAIISKGLVKPSYNPSGSMIVYATAEGSVADDNSKSRNGLFTAELLKHLTIPNLTLRQILDRTKRGVEQSSNRRQSPARYDNLSDEFVFVIQAESPATTTKTIPAQQQIEPAKPIILTPLELYKQGELAFQKKDYVEAKAYYEQAVSVGNSDAMNALGYMSQMGLGANKDIKQAKIWYERAYSLSNHKAAYNLGYIYEFGVEVNIIKAKEYYQKSCDWGDASGCERVQFLSKSEKPLDINTKSKMYLDLPFAEMANIPGGTFEMGSNEGETNEMPLHSVTVSSLQMGKYEVTVGQFAKFVATTNYVTDAEKSGGSYIWNIKENKWELKEGINWRYNATGNQELALENHPVIHVSHNDAISFCRWLSIKDGISYRLPTEAEWEYSAGNGRVHNKYSWGNAGSGYQGNVSDETAAKELNWVRNKTNVFIDYTDGFTFTSPVGSFKANSYGLFDMTGNVFEWCNDWYGADYYSKSSSSNPTGVTKDVNRVLRGGSWFDDPENSRVANRNFANPNFRSNYTGFRVVLSL